MSNEEGEVSGWRTMKSEIDSPGDRPAHCAIEITPEMIESGLLHLYRYHPDTGVDDEETVRRIFLAMLDAAQSEPETTPLNEMGESIRKHGLPEIDRSPQPFWKNETAAFNLGDGTTVMVDPAENLRGKDS